MANALVLPKLRAPIVLVHGLFGFDRLQVGGYTVASYWPGIVEMLRGFGNRVLVPALSPTAGVAERAGQLKNFLDSQSPAEAVHIFAHSMGGLDARYMISCLDMADRVLSLTTLGTPHRGSAFADWSVGRLARLLKPVFQLLGVPAQAFYDVTTTSCCRFNELVKDAPAVRYFSVAGRHNGSLLHPEWLLPHSIVFKSEGPNDGVVSVQSATWGESTDIWPGDHFSLVNWLHPWSVNRSFWRDPAPRYGPLVRRLAAEGF